MGSPLTARQRAGHDALGYSDGFLGWGVLLAACLGAWTVAAVAIARRMSWPAPRLRVEVRLAVGVTTAMAVMTAATAVWWRVLAGSAPWFLAGLLGLAGSWRAMRGNAGHSGQGSHATLNNG